MKKILFLVLIFLIPSYSFACKYSDKIEKCSSAVKSFVWASSKIDYITAWSSIKSIEDFPCLQDTPERRAFQIWMDHEFKKIDKEMDEYLDNLYNAKDFYFWSDSEKYTYFEWLNHIWKKTKYFKNNYYKACQQVFKELPECIEDGSISISEASEFIKWSTKWDENPWNDSSWDCYWLADIKVNIFNEVAYNWLILNQKNVLEDEKKDYTQKQRKKYDKVLDLMMINFWYIERLWRKLPSMTKNPL